MKIDRLLGILVLLSKKEIVTAPQLAEYFEVSKRTINRDIESLCMAGIPIVTKQGNKGGIYIQDGYKVDKSIFKEKELTDIITGLRAVKSVSQSDDIERLLKKIIPVDSNEYDNIVKIELGSFYKDSIAEKIDIVKSAISDCKCVEFTYYSSKGKNKKNVEPYYVIFKWDNWYLYGYSDDFRLFKLNRLWDIEITDKVFAKRKIKYKIDVVGDIFKSNYHLKAIFESSEEYKLVEEYGNKSYDVLEDCRLLFQRDFTNYHFMLNWILGYGQKVKVLEPKELIDDIRNIANEIIGIYK